MSRFNFYNNQCDGNPYNVNTLYGYVDINFLRFHYKIETYLRVDIFCRFIMQSKSLEISTGFGDKNGATYNAS